MGNYGPLSHSSVPALSRSQNCFDKRFRGFRADCVSVAPQSKNSRFRRFDGLGFFNAFNCLAALIAHQSHTGGSPISQRDHTRRPDPEAGLLTIQPADVLRAADELLYPVTTTPENSL